MKDALFGLVVGGIVVAAAFLFIAPVATPAVQPPLGSAGSEFSFRAIFRDNVVVGGNDFATSSQGTVTYTAAMINNARVIEHNASAALTATLPTNAALSAVGFLPNAGDTQTFFVHATTTSITFAGNTGLTLMVASTTKQVPTGQTGRFDCVRLGATEARLIQCLLIAD